MLYIPYKTHLLIIKYQLFPLNKRKCFAVSYFYDKHQYVSKTVEAAYLYFSVIKIFQAKCFINVFYFMESGCLSKAHFLYFCIENLRCFYTINTIFQLTHIHFSRRFMLIYLKELLCKNHLNVYTKDYMSTNKSIGIRFGIKFNNGRMKIIQQMMRQLLHCENKCYIQYHV